MEDYDAIVVGSGFAGLFAASRLQRKGLSTLLIEKSSGPGGLCGNFELKGYEFHRACFEYPELLQRELRQSGLDYPFFEPKGFVFLHGKRINFPFKAMDIVKLAPYCFDILRLLKNIKSKKFEYLSELVEASVKNDFFKSLVYLFSLGESAPPEKVALKSIAALFDKELNYGYQKPIVPVGGNKKLIDAMVDHLQSLGVVFLFNTEKEQIINHHSHKEVITNQGSYTARYVVTSEDITVDKYPQEYGPALANSVILLAIDKQFEFPDITEALYLPRAPTSADSSDAFWMNDIYQGKMPDDHGFILSKTDLTADDHITVNIYCHAPLGVDQPDAKQTMQLCEPIYRQLEQMFPGISDAIIFKHFLSVAEYEQRLHFRPQHAPFHMLANSEKPANHDAETDIYYIGKSVYPQGENSGASMLSGITVAEAIISREANEAKATTKTTGKAMTATEEMA
ncbi:MAG: NAD(P)/FAD-dependent oxidoreductase [Pseudomonadales bacterium]|nr:NAD(P)/FAD-dependent oxidoreductase [Pseudomonadales bacterium]